MRHIMVMNPKGGCGKTTIATNLAAAYASEGSDVVIADYDPQASSMQWLERRPEKMTPITGVPAYQEGLRNAPRNADFLIMDAPASIRGSEMTELLNKTETLIVPVLPSPIDIEATARFLTELRKNTRIKSGKTKVSVVANRVKTYTIIFDQLEEFLDSTKIPYIAALRDAQNYNRAYTRGLGVFELPEYLAWPDWEQWNPLLDYVDSRQSQAA